MRTLNMKCYYYVFNHMKAKSFSRNNLETTQNYSANYLNLLQNKKNIY